MFIQTVSQSSNSNVDSVAPTPAEARAPRAPLPSLLQISGVCVARGGLGEVDALVAGTRKAVYWPSSLASAAALYS